MVENTLTDYEANPNKPETTETQNLVTSEADDDRHEIIETSDDEHSSTGSFDQDEYQEKLMAERTKPGSSLSNKPKTARNCQQLHNLDGSLMTVNDFLDMVRRLKQNIRDGHHNPPEILDFGK